MSRHIYSPIGNISELMVTRYEYSGPWFRAGAVFGLAFLAMMFSTFQQISYFYFEDIEDLGGGTNSEWCKEFSNGVDITVDAHCNQLQIDMQISVVLTLISLGLTMICMAQSRYLEEEVEESEPSNFTCGHGVSIHAYCEICETMDILTDKQD